MRNKPVKLALAVVTFGVAAIVMGNDFSLDWWTIDSGGATFTTGGDFELSGTIGQPDANVTVMSGGAFELTGGFWPGAEAPFCFGDLDGDGDIDLSDLAQLLSNYGETGGKTYEDGDLDGDGDVDLSDLAALLAVYGADCP